jgi:hypothetical protein
VGPALLGDRRAERRQLLRLQQERPAGLDVRGRGYADPRRRLGGHVVEEERELAEGDLVPGLERARAPQPFPVEERAVARVEVSDDPLHVLQANLHLVAGHRDVVDHDVQAGLATDLYHWPVDVVDLQGPSLDDQCELWHMASPLGSSNGQATNGYPEKALRR